jgi:hypothetical protein
MVGIKRTRALTLKEAVAAVAERLSMPSDALHDAAWPCLLTALQGGEVVATGQSRLLSGSIYNDAVVGANDKWSRAPPEYREWLSPNELALNSIPQRPRAIEERHCLEIRPNGTVSNDWWHEDSVPKGLRGVDIYLSRRVGENFEC